jgi:hypothetical protein
MAVNMWSVLISLVLYADFANGNLCDPCDCIDHMTIDCSNMYVLTKEVMDLIEQYKYVVLESSVIDRDTVKLQTTLVALKPSDCDLICAIKDLRSTCSCNVSIFIIYNS